MNLRKISSWLFLLLLWVPVIKVMELEWRYNEQYNYGYFVPFFALYLFHLRWSDRPASSPPTLSWIFLAGVTLLMIPIQLVETANPDWRSIYWVATVAAICITLLFLDQLGGKRWIFYFFPALAMILFAVPWGTQLETMVTANLMRIVAAVTVEVVNLIGIYAVQTGNVIRLPGSIVGVEEACSGVRSLQSSLMAGYLFGEMFRLRPLLRVVLIASAICLTFILNLVRTIVLTLITHAQGTEGFENWHDPVGNLLVVIGFAGIALFTWIIVRTSASSRKDAKEVPEPRSPQIPKLMKTGPLTVLIVILIGSLGFDYLWYAPSRKSSDNIDFSEIHWEKLSDDLKPMDISPITTAQLKYSEGHQYSWKQADGSNWMAFYFRWDVGQISSHAGVHRPENCLPASGLDLVKTHEPLIWNDPRGIEIPFRCFTFKGFGGKIFVFFTVWDENGDQPWYSLTWVDRFRDVLNKRLVNGRHSLEFIVENTDSMDEAKAEVLQNLSKIFGEP